MASACALAKYDAAIGELAKLVEKPNNWMIRRFIQFIMQEIGLLMRLLLSFWQTKEVGNKEVMVNEELMQYAFKTYKEKGHGRELVFFGLAPEMQAWFNDKGMRVEKVFSRRKDIPCIPATELNQKKDRYFVFCHLRNNDTESFLGKKGFQELEDSVFYRPKTVLVSDINIPYEDMYGNRICGNGIKAQIKIMGVNNQIDLSDYVGGGRSTSYSGSGEQKSYKSRKGFQYGDKSDSGFWRFQQGGYREWMQI